MLERKFGSYQVLSATLAPGRGLGPRQATLRTAHRHTFTYEPRPGYLYVRSRAISSRCNDNFDEFPADEIKKAYATFVGKPVFVNHHNDDHRRARGVIIDAALHDDVNPDGSPDTWVEVLMEVDAVRFPKLAQAILAGEIDRTSMGTDVAFSVCSFCHNKASTPAEYCAHIPKLKGKRIYRRTASGAQEGVLVREICHGLAFFENSLLVEEPADPTAFFLGVEAGPGVAKAASKTAAVCDGAGKPTEDGKCPVCRLPIRDKDGVVVSHSDPHGGESTQWLGFGTAASKTAAKFKVQFDFAKGAQWNKDMERKFGPRNEGIEVEASDEAEARKLVGQAEKMNPFYLKAVTARRATALGETIAPPKVDTLRDENCPVCGEADSYDGDKCQVCGFIKPPDQFLDPDLETAKNTDLRQEQDEATPGEGDLKCSNCGHMFNSESSPDNETTQAPAFIPPDNPKQAVILDKDNGKEGDRGLQKSNEDEAEANAEAPSVAPKEGDSCPECGEGTLQRVSAEAAPQDGQQDKDQADGDGGKEGEGKSSPPWMKDKDKKTSAVRPGQTQKEHSMRPALAALAEQQKVIQSQEQRIAAVEALAFTIAKAAGIEDHPAVRQMVQARRTATLVTKADINNPTQPIPDPPAEAPAATTEETLGDLNDEDVEAIGATSVTDVSADATTSLEDTGTVLDAPLDLNELDVTAPVAGTEGPRPLDEVKTTTEVRAGDPNQPDVAFPLQGDFAQRATTGSKEASEGRTFASIRLARLRIQAGIAPTNDDMSLANVIATSEVTDDAIQTEIDTLAKVVQASGGNRRQPIARNLVPQAARQASRTMPSVVASEAVAPEPQVAYAPSADEFAFE